MDAKSSHGNHIYKSNGDGNSDQAKKRKEKNPQGDAIEEVKIGRPRKNNIIASFEEWGAEENTSEDIFYGIFDGVRSEPSFARNTQSSTSMGSGAYNPQEITYSSAPSFSAEKTRPFTSTGSRPYERKSEDLISSLSVAVQKTFIVRPQISSAQKNIHEMDEEEIPGEAAVCRYCFKIFEEENILKLKCKCTVAGLAHDACMRKRSRANENYCDGCGQKLESMPVKLLHKREVTNSAGRHKKEHKKKKFFSFFNRMWLCCS